MEDQTKAPSPKKVWAKPGIYFLASGYINSGTTPAHNEASFHIKTFTNGISFGTVDNAPRSVTYPFTQIHHS